MRYPEQLIAPMRQDLVQYGVQETKTAEEVDKLLTPGSGTVLMITNSVCGCAAGKARPAIGMALKHANKPDVVATVFAGGDEEAVARVREKLNGVVPPSSPSMALFQDGKPVFVLHRFHIERADAPQISQLLTQAFDQFCVTAKQ
jgi:putative YphP/YqiW family bacilliredoxin